MKNLYTVHLMHAACPDVHATHTAYMTCSASIMEVTCYAMNGKEVRRHGVSLASNQPRFLKLT
jgi:hypothetical protein